MKAGACARTAHASGPTWSSRRCTVSDGSLTGYAKVTRDLTERRRHEESLRNNEVRFRTLVEGVRDYAIYMLDPDGAVATWNAGAQQIHGVDAIDVIGTHFSRFLVPDGTERERAGRELQIAAREGRFQDEGWRMRSNGTRFWANVVITAIRDQAGHCSASPRSRAT